MYLRSQFYFAIFLTLSFHSFQAPQPPEPWEGIRDATSEGNVSAQIDPIVTKSFVGDENCLFLNVYTPNLDGSFLPVMVYIHGGGLIFGSGNTDMYGPDYLIEKDVVVVTLNYRLGALGFLSLNTPEVPGNAGIKDVVQALRWVKENIHNFGGNSKNLTVFGESAGGRLVSVLTASPMSKDLISRAIMQSGTALSSSFTQTAPVDKARKLAKALGCDAENVDEILEFLSATPVKDIVEAQEGICSFDDVLGRVLYDFSLVVEKEFPGVEAIITEPFADLLKSGRVAQVPVMIGSTSLEFAVEKEPNDYQIFIPKELNIEKNSETSLAIAEEIKKMYSMQSQDVFLEYCQLISDKLVNIDNHRYAQYLLHSTNVPIYLYKFDYVGELNISGKILRKAIRNQCMHCDDLGYIFKNEFQKSVVPTPQDVEMRERMVRLWTNFAKTGNPTPGEDRHISVTWLPVVKGNEHFFRLAPEIGLGYNYDVLKMDFWDGLYEKYYKVWNESEQNTAEVPKNDPIIVETLTLVTSSTEESKTEPIVVETFTVVTDTNGHAQSNETGETVTNLVEIISEAVETSSGLVETVLENVETTPDVVETVVSVVETTPKVEESASEVDAPKATKEPPKVEQTNSATEKPHLNGNSHERSVKRTSNEIKMVQNSNGVPRDVIRANDPPEDDLPKNIGVNKFVNFFESLGGKK